MYVLVLVAALSADEYPAAALAAIQSAAKTSEDARNAYLKKTEQVREKLVADLQRQLENATKRGDFTAATALKKDLTRLEKEDFLTLMEDLLGNSSLLDSTKHTWIGYWDVKIGPKFEGHWDVKADGTVNENGRWRINLLEQKLRITWANGGWEDVSLPLSQELVKGINREGLQVFAKKKR